MLTKSALSTVLRDQRMEVESVSDSIPRDALDSILSHAGDSALVIKGVRRCGKSTLMMQLIALRFGEDFLYVNFDDERLYGFKASDFQTLMEASEETFGKTKNLFFDEIQNIPGWELYANRMLRVGNKIFITGSNANLLSRELGSHLTGRHTDMELFPFSFREYLKAKEVKITKSYSTKEKATLTRHFKDYLKNGGMPEPTISGNQTILTQLINDIIQKDIVVRHGVRKPQELKIVLNFMIANSGASITYRSLLEHFRIKSPNTIQKYIEYARETYLLFTVNRYEKRLKLLEKNPKKIYCMDNGLVSQIMPDHMEKNGALLENLIAIQLYKNRYDFYYYRGKTNNEADFVIPKKNQAIQVCYNLTEKNREREVRGLLEAMEQINAEEGIILTLEQEQEIHEKNKIIIVIPAWQWLLQQSIH
jgi:uncharacterized protein